MEAAVSHIGASHAIPTRLRIKMLFKRFDRVSVFEKPEGVLRSQETPPYHFAQTCLSIRLPLQKR